MFRAARLAVARMHRPHNALAPERRLGKGRAGNSARCAGGRGCRSALRQRMRGTHVPAFRIPTGTEPSRSKTEVA